MVDLKFKEIEERSALSRFQVLQLFMFERVLERISVSQYRDNFILKGGLLLSAMFGIDNRTTCDMDTTIKGLNISKEKMLLVLNEILSIDLKDKVKFDVVKITDIKKDDDYGGNRYHLLGKYGNTKVNFYIDISTGDSITPRELKYKYPLKFEDRSILISSYNIETIMAEKMEAILKRGKYNSRMKDYYDIYVFLTRLKNDINLTVLKEAVNNTFNKRGSICYLQDYKNIIESILKSEKVNLMWTKYSKSSKYKYAANISLKEIMDCLREFIEMNFI